MTSHVSWVIVHVSLRHSLVVSLGVLGRLSSLASPSGILLGSFLLGPKTQKLDLARNHLLFVLLDDRSFLHYFLGWRWLHERPRLGLLVASLVLNLESLPAESDLEACPDSLRLLGLLVIRGLDLDLDGLGYQLILLMEVRDPRLHDLGGLQDFGEVRLIGDKRHLPISLDLADAVVDDLANAGALGDLDESLLLLSILLKLKLGLVLGWRVLLDLLLLGLPLAALRRGFPLLDIISLAVSRDLVLFL